MKGNAKLAVVVIAGLIILGIVFRIYMHNQRHDLYRQVKQFDDDVRRGRYTPVEVPGGVRYEKNW